MDGLYRAPWWLPGGHLQTIVAALWGRQRLEKPHYRRERWTTPDGDFIDVDQLDEADGRPVIVLFHGLEGSSLSHYAMAFAHECRRRHWGYVVPHFRGCSGEINRGPRAYHSGDAEEIEWILDTLRQKHPRIGPLYAVGISLGGNALMKWCADAGDRAASTVSRAVAVCSPLDLAAAGAAIDRGMNRHLYARMFLRTMKRKARQKWNQYPGLFDLNRALAARTLEAFDDVFTAPLHGFRGVHDYWRRASAKPGLRHVKIPALVLNARNDPFIPSASLPGPSDVARTVQLWQPMTGGHVGFADDLRLQRMPRAVCDWLSGDEGSLHG